MNTYFAWNEAGVVTSSTGTVTVYTLPLQLVHHCSADTVWCSIQGRKPLCPQPLQFFGCTHIQQFFSQFQALSSQVPKMSSIATLIFIHFYKYMCAVD